MQTRIPSFNHKHSKIQIACLLGSHGSKEASENQCLSAAVVNVYCKDGHLFLYTAITLFSACLPWDVDAHVAKCDTPSSTTKSTNLHCGQGGRARENIWLAGWLAGRLAGNLMGRPQTSHTIFERGEQCSRALQALSTYRATAWFVSAHSDAVHLGKRKTCSPEPTSQGGVGDTWIGKPQKLGLMHRDSEYIPSRYRTLSRLRNRHRNRLDCSPGLVACINSTQAPTPLPKLAAYSGASQVGARTNEPCLGGPPSR
ncbi:hypothetical protein PMIN01_05476 [Paraphaeosphaeria minitans]|uniref:Uncharacterized protein n=1 Tax=Paraphaeosphaeria minitans TaxID=565426 RepID=A0A9P6GL84_9PLEO|nr:hypothetical protein PMIN01_05476 [Paraphaeosphaeria minitans]